MKCELCGKKESSFHFLNIRNNELTEMHVCIDCQKKRNGGEQAYEVDNSGYHLLEGLIKSGKVEKSSVPELNCSACGTNSRDITKTQLLGCAHCYEIFSDIISPDRKAGDVMFARKSPAFSIAHNVQELKRELKKAVEDLMAIASHYSSLYDNDPRLPWYSIEENIINLKWKGDIAVNISIDLQNYLEMLLSSAGPVEGPPPSKAAEPEVTGPVEAEEAVLDGSDETQEDIATPITEEVVREAAAPVGEVVAEEESADMPGITDKAVYDTIVSLLQQEYSRVTKRKKIEQKQILKISLLIINYISQLKNDALSYVSRGSVLNRLEVHCVNVALLSALTAIEFKIRGQELLKTVTGALLHDVGILLLGGNPDTETLKTHTVIGFRYLKASGIEDQMIALPVLQHHEKANGNGYPQGIGLERIGQSSRITAVCDSSDNQMSFIKYGNDISIHYTREDFLSWNKDAFDGTVLRSFITAVREFAEKEHTVPLNDGRTALVQGINIRFPLNPVVQVDGEEDKTIDLRKTKEIWIDRRMS